jgi:hypothetical protein
MLSLSLLHNYWGVHIQFKLLSPAYDDFGRHGLPIPRFDANTIQEERRPDLSHRHHKTFKDPRLPAIYSNAWVNKQRSRPLGVSD